MRKLLLITLGISAALFAHAQSYKWANHIGSFSWERGTSVCVDTTGNVYNTGFFKGSVDFDPGPGTTMRSSEGNSDIYIQKLDPLGNLIWVKTMGSSQDDYGLSIKTDPFNNVYCTGFFRGTVDFDPTVEVTNLSSSGLDDVFVIKLNSAGELIWAKKMGGAGSDSGNGIYPDNYGNIYTTGHFSETADFDPGIGIFNLISNGNTDIFIQKLDVNGDLLWCKSIGGIGEDIGKSIFINSLDEVVFSGHFTHLVDFDPNESVYSISGIDSHDGFIEKLDSAGNFVWVRPLIDTYSVNAISLDTFGNIYSTGAYRGTVDFDPGMDTAYATAVNGIEIFIHKMDADGNFLWVKTMDGTEETDSFLGNVNQGHSIDVDLSANVYTTGYFQQSTDFDPGIDSLIFTAIVSNSYVQKLNTNGDLIWAHSIGGSSQDIGRGVAVDESENVYLTGSFGSTVDFDFGVGTANLTSNGSGDIYVLKIGPCVETFGVDLVSACNSFTWIDGITYFESNNTAKDTLTNAVGCDSIVSLNLTINALDSSVTQIENTLMANEEGALYQWVTCPELNPITGATEQTFIPSENSQYAVIIEKDGCEEISNCIEITSLGITEVNLPKEIDIYPNPFDQNVIVKLQLDLKENEIITLEIYNQLSQQVGDYVLKNGTNVLSDLNFVSGLYTAIIRQNGILINRSRLVKI